MKTLKNYELQRGDWVKLHGSEWHEYEGLDDFNQHRFITNNYIKSNFVEAVLRPKINLRDTLDDKLRMARQYLAEGLLPTSFIKSYSFELILPKEEKKSLFEKITGFKEPVSTIFIKELRQEDLALICDEIDKLKNKENEG